MTQPARITLVPAAGADGIVGLCGRAFAVGGLAGGSDVTHLGAHAS
jgi:hypothetical protein